MLIKPLVSHTNAVGVVEVVILLAIGVQLSCQGHVGKLVSARWRFLVLALDTVEISVEQARVAVISEEDERVCKWLEEALDGGSDSLSLLGVVVLHNGLITLAKSLQVENQTYHSVDGHGLDESLVKDSP